MKTKNAILIFALFVAAVPSPVFALSCEVYGSFHLFCNLSIGERAVITKKKQTGAAEGTLERWIGVYGCEKSSGSRLGMQKVSTEKLSLSGGGGIIVEGAPQISGTPLGCADIYIKNCWYNWLPHPCNDLVHVVPYH
jgi:hypothetical protein